MNDYLESFEEYLDEFEIKYFVTDKFEGSDYEGYICIYIDEDSFSKEILFELGFEKIEDNLLYKKLEEFDEIDDKFIEKIKLYYSDKYSIIAKKGEYAKRIMKLKKIWDEIGDKIYEINQFFLKKYDKEFFMPTLETLDLSLRLTNTVAMNERSFGEFCYHLYQFGRESILKKTSDKLFELLQTKYPYECKSKDDSKEFLKNHLLEIDPFYYQIDKLRHYEIHLTGNMSSDFIDEIKRVYLSYLGKLPTNDFEYFLLQLRILKDFDSFLEKIYTIITTKI
jgi:hypothetical protein